jgi:hypothetical protein
MGLQVPHRECYGFWRQELLRWFAHDELWLPADQELPAFVLRVELRWATPGSRAGWCSPH